ncbi:MAG: Rieske 2Fe-2S domain-containing protein, partial [Actinobacteria bacterium]|nr:Rieske 2Fe-2S domain-containing protein [Actinomycetota bacterium]
MSDSAGSVRTLDRGRPPERFARGWHCLGLAETFRDGAPHAIEAFGGKLVVWADSSGDLQVLDAYCRHMGGDLTQGTVKGDEIACPFHDWRWGGDGKCKAIPYARRVPLRARTQKYPTAIVNDQLLIWHDAEGGAADHDILPPQLPGVGTSEYTNWTWETT